MCDIYEAKCAVCGIGGLRVHLGDWSTRRSEIECFCKGHLPKINARVFTVTKRISGYKKGWKMGIRALTENAVRNKEKNHPNINTDYDIEDR